MKQLTLKLNHAEALFLAEILSAAKEDAAARGLRETDSDEQHRQIKRFQHADEVGQRLNDIARREVFGW